MATIYNVESGKFLGVSENGYIELMNENGSSNQVWKFERFEDGSYTIRSAYNGKYLSVENNSDENFARLCLLDYNNLSGQRFKFYSQGNGYIIYPNCSLSRVVDRCV